MTKKKRTTKTINIEVRAFGIYRIQQNQNNITKKIRQTKKNIQKCRRRRRNNLECALIVIIHSQNVQIGIMKKKAIIMTRKKKRK